MAKCCSPARAKLKIAARQKATAAALKAVKSGKPVKKAKAKKTHAKKAHAKQAPPCRICGKGNK